MSCRMWIVTPVCHAHRDGRGCAATGDGRPVDEHSPRIDNRPD